MKYKITVVYYIVLFVFRFKIMHFSEAFFVHELPWKSLLNVTDSRYTSYKVIYVLILIISTSYLLFIVMNVYVSVVSSNHVRGFITRQAICCRTKSAMY